MHLTRLDNDVIFKKAFFDQFVLTQFIKDILGLDLKIKKIETEKRLSPKIAYINFAYDIFAQSEDERVIVEIQRVNYDYNFDRFLHYHTMALDRFDLLQESIHHPQNPQINLNNQAIKKVATLIEEDNLTPDERHATKIAAATEQTLQLYEKKGRREAQLEMAKKMKAKGFEVETIAEMTQLEVEIINQIETK